MITSKELAKLAGVSQSTVSRALNDSDLVSDETKEKIKELAIKYNFTFNHAAQSLKSKKTGFIGYVFSENFKDFVSNVAQGCLFHSIGKVLKDNNLDIVPIFESSQNIKEYVRNKKVDGLVINRFELDDELITLLEKHKIPYILIYDVDEYSSYPYIVASNHYKSGYIVGEAFADRNFDKFVEVTGSKDRVDVLRKHKGFKDALIKRNLKIDDKNILEADYTVEGAKEVALSNIDIFKNANACFVHNDAMAIGVIEALKSHNIKVPEDISIIGHDDVPMATWFSPNLTTISINYDRIAEITVDWMKDLLKGNKIEEFRKVVVNSELIIRDTLK